MCESPNNACTENPVFRHPVTVARLVAGSTSLAASTALAAMPVVTATSSLTFSPATVVVVQGSSVRFVNGGGFHNVHADDGSFVCSVDCTTNNGPNSSDWNVVVMFDAVGTIGYYCEEHGGTGAGMRGSIIVVRDAVFADGFDPGR
jgi:plastocyanin